MKPFFKNRYIDAIAKNILLLAFIHILTVALFSLLSGRYEILNIFSILGLTLFFPQIGKGLTSFIAATIVLFFVYIAVYVTLTGKDDKKVKKHHA